MIDRRGSIARIGRQASASAKATGTRMTMSRKNVPNRMMAAVPALRTLPPITFRPQTAP